MESFKYFRIIFCFTLLVQLFAAPVQQDEFCSGNQMLYNYENGKEYIYDYETETKLWINDVSDEAKSTMTLKSTVMIQPFDNCYYQLRMDRSSLSGESLSQNDLSDILSDLDNYKVLFRMNQQGELDSELRFEKTDSQWSRNIKRAIVSILQAKSRENLNDFDQMNPNDDTKSATIYENDILGRCRTTYKVVDQSSTRIKLNKVKSLQRCTLNNNAKSSAIQYVPYLTLPEFYQGRLFIEDYQCNTIIENNQLTSVECDEVSTYKIGSRGRLGAQAIVNQRLTFKEASSSAQSVPRFDSWDKQSIQYSIDEKQTSLEDEVELKNFDTKKYMQDLCDNGLKQGLSNEHSNDFKYLVLTLRNYKSSSDLMNLYQTMNSKCQLAGLTLSQALLFADTEYSFETVLNLIDRDVYDELRYINEFPLLTALARNQEPSENLINKLRDYLKTKSAQQDFKYLNKLYLVYSSLIKTRCSKVECDSTQLNDWSSVFERHLRNDCSSDDKLETIVTALKSIGNIGYFKQTQLISNCASKKENPLEIRVNAIESLRRFRCDQVENLDFQYDLLNDRNEDSEIRINSFLSLMRCSDESARFMRFAENDLAKFLLDENDVQLLTFIIDYGKEHSLTTVLNAVLNEPKIKEKFSVNFKELSWNNYRYKYSIMRDSAFEVETSVIYTAKTFIPRSIKLNCTMHMFGMSVNFMQMNLRLEGLDEILKASIVDQLKSEKLLQKIMQKPEQLIELLNVISNKLKYTQEKPQISMNLRIYGSDVYYSRLDNADEFNKLRELFSSPKDNLYKQIMTIRNLYLVDSRNKQPLMNGFSFVNTLDISGSLLLSKQSKRDTSDSEYEFDLQNFYSLSLAINRRYDIQINNRNKLSIKKKSFVNGRLRLDIDGTKQDGKAVYRLNLTPVNQLPLVTIEGRFYKLTNGNQYKEVKEFKVEQTKYDSCTSERFETAFGVNLCLSVERPSVSLKESLRYILFEDAEQSMMEDDMEFEDADEDELHYPNDGHDHDSNQILTRPSLLLSGPYRYQLLLKNPDLIKTIVFTAELQKDKNSFDFKANLQTQKQNGQTKDTLNIVYTRERKVTNRGLRNKMNLELRKPSSNEIRFQALADFEYQKNDLLAANFVVDNKINREFLMQLNFGRNVTNTENIIPTWYIESKFDSKWNMAKPIKYRLFSQVQPNGKNIRGDLTIDALGSLTNYKNVQLVNAQLTLDHDENSEDDLDYTLNMNAKTSRGGQMTLNGQIVASLLKSNINLKLDYSNPSFRLERPANIKLAHRYDGSVDAKSFIELYFDIPHTPIKHGSKLLFRYNIESKGFDYIEVQILKPNRNEPISIYMDKKKVTSTEYELVIGLTGSQLNLNDYSYLDSLVKIDNDNMLRSFEFRMNRMRDENKKQRSNQITFKKNEQAFISIEYSLRGDLNKLRESDSEISRQLVGGDITTRIFNTKAGLSAYLDFESSFKNDKHEFKFDLKTQDLIRQLVEIEQIKSVLSMNRGRLNANIEVTKTKDIKSFKFTSRGNVRSSSGNMKEFDIDYEKTLEDGTTVKSTGVARYSFTNFKNFEYIISVPQHYESGLKLETRRTNKNDLFGYHLFRFTNKHLSGSYKMEREIKIMIDNEVTQNDKSNFEFTLKRGPLNTLDNRNKLNLLINLNTQMIDDTDSKLWPLYANNVIDFKSARLDIDLTNTLLIDRQDKSSVNIDMNTNAKFPSIISEPGKTRELTHKLTYTRNKDNSLIKMTNNFETTSKLFGRLFRKLNVQFNRQQQERQVNANLDITYTKQDQQSDEKQFKITWQHDYKTMRATMKQNRLTKVRSLFGDDKQFEINDCLFNGKYDRQNKDEKYLLDVLFDLNCNNRRLLTDSLLVKVDQKNTDSPMTTFKFSTVSDVYYKEYSVEVQHQKFTQERGLIRIVTKPGSSDLYVNELSYTRKLNEDKQANKATYRLEIVNPSFEVNHKCDLNVDRTNSNYVNELNCNLNNNGPWGYYLSLEKPFMPLSGKRSIQFDLTCPQRKMRLTYNSNYATPFDTTDDDDDENNEREFNATATIQYDLLRDPTQKLIQLNLKRDNRGKGQSTFYIEVVQHPKFNTLRFQIMRIRTFNQTLIQPSFMYELKNGYTNRFDIDIRMSSDMETNTFSVETNLQRPKFNTLYENRYNKYNGRLQYLGIRLGKLIKLNIDKESDPEQRRISLEFVNPDFNKYEYTAQSSLDSSNKYKVEGVLSRNSRQISKIVSVFDSNNNRFNVEVTGLSTGKRYAMNFAMFNETVANAVIRNINDNIVLAKARLSIDQHDEHRDLVLDAKWNRLWSALQQDILANQDTEQIAQENTEYNSYFGDVYSVLSADLKPAVDSFKQERLTILRDFGYMQSEQEVEQLPLYKRLYTRYNALAKQLTNMSVWLRTYNKRLSTYVPRLPIVEYNPPQITREKLPFDNNLVIRRPTLNARNLYQFNAEYRNYIRSFGDNVLFAKSSLVRNMDGFTVKGFINKYKYRSLRDYTIVGNVFNRRNIIGFDGEQTVLQSKCRYLLAHETHKNRFSVVLNFNDNQYPISIYAYGQKSVDISYNKAAIANKPISLPQTIKLPNENGYMSVTRSSVATCVELNNDLRVCCYEDSSSCTIATTRWFTGKLNGLLGSVNKNVEKIQESEWYLDKSCKYPNINLRKPSDEAVSQCYSLFGKHSRSLMKNAMMAIRPNGWQRMCESVLTADSKNKCNLLKSFDHYADELNVDIEAPTECFTCNQLRAKYTAGERVIKSESTLSTNFEKGSDYVFLTLPCDKSKYTIDFDNFVRNLKSRNPLNRYYVVSVDQYDSSIYQSPSNEVFNFELRKAYETLSDDSTIEVKRQQFNKALYLAASLFSKRLAQNRYLVIRSCGNCLPYDPIDAIKYTRLITERNVIVHSWGDYEMKNLDNEDDDEIPIGYNEEDVYLYKSQTRTVDTDSLDSYKIEHKADLCQRLAVKTKGTVMNINYLRQNEIMYSFDEMLNKLSNKYDYEYKINKCQKIDTPFGDLVDFSFTKKRIERDD